MNFGDEGNDLNIPITDEAMPAFTSIMGGHPMTAGGIIPHDAWLYGGDDRNTTWTICRSPCSPRDWCK
jgi:hypothetical protein